MTQQVSGLCWVDFNFGSSTVCLILLGLMRDIGRMGGAAGQDEWNFQIKVNPTQFRDLLCHWVVNEPENLTLVKTLQGNPAPSSKPPVDIDLKLRFSMGTLY